MRVKGSNPILIIAFILIVISIVLFILQHEKQKPPVENNSDWQTYTNDFLGYQFSYPKDRQLITCRSTDLDGGNICIYNYDSRVSDVPILKMDQRILLSPTHANNISKRDQTPKEFCNSMGEIATCEEIQVNGMTAYKKIWTNEPFVDIAVFKDSKPNFMFRLEGLPGSIPDTKVFDQVVSSFVFGDYYPEILNDGRAFLEWDKIVKLNQECRVKVFDEQKNRDVQVTFEYGNEGRRSTIHTREPVYNDILREIERVKEKCGDIFWYSE